MRIKKKQITEMVAQTNTSNTSNTSSANSNNTSSNQNNTNKPELPKPEDIEKSKKAVEDLDKKVAKINKDVKDGPMGAFLKGGDGLTENNLGDVSTFAADAIDAEADREEQNRQDYDEWLQSPEGQEYIKSMDSLSESISGRKIIKTIKVKDLK